MPKKIKVNCSTLSSDDDPKFLEEIEALGVEPIVTGKLIKTTYTGNNSQIAQRLIDLFERRPDHDIYRNGI